MSNQTLQTAGMIYQTTNYDLFKFQNGNRTINKRNYKKLLESVKEEQLRIPIIVNENMEIIDGQHRYLSWKEEKKPIFYIVNEGYGLKQTKLANIASSNWNNNDFLQTYVIEGKESYILLDKLRRNYGIGVAELLFLFTLYQNKNINAIKKDFYNGNFTDDGKERVLEFLESLELFDEMAFSRNTKFIRAFAKIYNLAEYDHEKMQRQFQSQGYKMTRQNSLDNYILMLLNDVYNFSTTRNKIGYDKENQIFYAV